MVDFCKDKSLVVVPTILVSWLFLIFNIFFLVPYNNAIAANSIDFYPPGDGPLTGNPITLTFNGKIYTESWWFDEVLNGTYTASEDEKSIMKIMDTCQKGTPQDVLDLWAPSERDQMKPDIFDPDLFAARQNFCKNAQFSAFMVKMLYGSRTIFLIQHTGEIIGNTIQEIPLVKVDNNYYLTNEMKSDPVFVYIVDKYINTLTFKKRTN